MGKKTTASAQSSVPAVGHNSAAVAEADRVQLISIVSKLAAADDAIEAARVPLKAAQAERKKIIGLGKAAGFSAVELEARNREMKVPTREMAATEARERMHRRWLGIVDDDQAELMLGDHAPAEAKDEAHWRGEGFKAGLRQLVAKPAAECPERFVQAWLLEHERGMTQSLAANAPKPLSVREQAATDFAEDHPEAASMADDRLAQKRQEKRARESLAAMTTPANDGPEDVV